MCLILVELFVVMCACIEGTHSDVLCVIRVLMRWVSSGELNSTRMCLILVELFILMSACIDRTHSDVLSFMYQYDGYRGQEFIQYIRTSHHHP